MKNKIPKNTEKLLVMAKTVSDAADQHGATIPMPSAPAVAPAIAALKTDWEAWLAAGTALKNSRTARNNLRKAAMKFAEDSRSHLKGAFGERHSPAWRATGFVKSLQIPRTDVGLESFLELLSGFFSANPQHENVAKNLVAIMAEELLHNLRMSRVDVFNHRGNLGQLRARRNEKIRLLSNRLRAVIVDLRDVLDPLDPRWTWFGLNRPGAEQTPAVPQNVVLTLGEPNEIEVTWDAAPRAEFYRVWMRLPGEEEFAAVGTPLDRDFTIGNLPANTQVEVAVSAGNSGGESALGEVKSVTTTLVLAA